MKKAPIKFLVSLAFFSLGATSALADDFHYINSLIGDRAAGMGGAYTAVSDDPAGLYYNPAGSVYGVGGDMSASMNAYQVTKTKYKDAIGDNDWNRSSDSIVPNFFGVVQNYGKWSVGFSYAVPTSSVEDQDQLFDDPFKVGNNTITRYSINFNEEFEDMLFGPSISYSPFKGFAVGLTGYYFMRDWKSINNQLVNFKTSTNRFGMESSNYYYEVNEKGFRPVLGVLVDAIPNVSVGVKLAKTYVTSSDARFQSTYLYNEVTKDAGGNVTGVFGSVQPSTKIVESGDTRHTPIEASVGVAWFPASSFLISADYNYYGDAEGRNFGADGKTNLHNKREKTWNAALGVEWYINEAWALRSGIFTNNANTNEPKAGGTSQLPNIDMNGVSLSVSRFSKGSSVSVGGSYAKGSGKEQLYSGSTTVQDVDMQSLSLFFSTTYSY